MRPINACGMELRANGGCGSGNGMTGASLSRDSLGILYWTAGVDSRETWFDSSWELILHEFCSTKEEEESQALPSEGNKERLEIIHGAVW